MATTLEAPKNINIILNDFNYKMITNEYNSLYSKYGLHKTISKQITNDFADIDELINNINNVSKSIETNQRSFKERKCYPSLSNFVYSTKELHDVIMNSKFSNYLHTHGSHDMSKPFDCRVLLYGLKYFDTHYLDKKTTNPILLSELVEIQNTFRSQKKEKIDNFIKKWTVKDRDIKINL